MSSKAAIAKVYQVGNYSVSETDTIRTQDIVRFAVQKQGAKSPYVVTFQTRAKSACSCIAGRNQKACKHVKMVRDCFGIKH